MDQLKLLTETLKETNRNKGTLFRTTIHPGLHVPALNTYGEHIAAHKELYKLLGADKLDEVTLKALLRAEGCGDGDFVHKESGRAKGKWALFKMLADRRGLDWTPFKNMADSRVDDSHKIREKTPRGEYYPARFREDAAKLALELRKLL